MERDGVWGIRLPANAEEAFERIDREELHKILFVNEIENDGLHTKVIDDLYAYLDNERESAKAAGVESVLERIEKKMRDIQPELGEEPLSTNAGTRIAVLLALDEIAAIRKECAATDGEGGE